MDIKPLLIETIRIRNGRVCNIKYHNDRCNKSRKLLFGSSNEIDLRRLIDTSKAKSEEVKCRITYDDEVRTVEYEHYILRPIHSLAFVEVGEYEYEFKYADRSKLNQLFDNRGDKDDILLTKNGFITDTSYANVALLKNDIWYTPKHPLLNGSCRARLLEKGMILESEIHVDQFNEYEAIAIFNSMIPFKRIIINLQFLG